MQSDEATIGCSDSRPSSCYAWEVMTILVHSMLQEVAITENLSNETRNSCVVLEFLACAPNQVEKSDEQFLSIH